MVDAVAFVALLVAAIIVVIVNGEGETTNDTTETTPPPTTNDTTETTPTRITNDTTETTPTRNTDCHNRRRSIEVAVSNAELHGILFTEAAEAGQLRAVPGVLGRIHRPSDPGDPRCRRRVGPMRSVDDLPKPDTAPEWEIRRNTADVLLEGLIELVAECQEELAPFGFDC